MVKNLTALFSSVQFLSPDQLFATPSIAARQASLSITNSKSLPRLMFIKLVMPSSHLILCLPLLLLPPIPPSIRDFSNESILRMRWPKYWSSASASVLPMKTQDWSPLGWTGWISTYPHPKEPCRVWKGKERVAPTAGGEEDLALRVVCMKCFSLQRPNLPSLANG